MTDEDFKNKLISNFKSYGHNFTILFTNYIFPFTNPFNPNELTGTQDNACSYLVRDLQIEMQKVLSNHFTNEVIDNYLKDEYESINKSCTDKLKICSKNNEILTLLPDEINFILSELNKTNQTEEL